MGVWVQLVQACFGLSGGYSLDVCGCWWTMTSRHNQSDTGLAHCQSLHASGYCVLRDLQCSRNVGAPFPRSVPRHSLVSELYGQFLQPHGLVLSLTCTVNCGTLYRQVCAFPTCGLQLTCRNISRMINGNRMHLSWISSLIAKGLNIYVNKVFLFYFLLTVHVRAKTKPWGRRYCP